MLCYQHYNKIKNIAMEPPIKKFKKPNPARSLLIPKKNQNVWYFGAVLAPEMYTPGGVSVTKAHGEIKHDI